MVGRSYLWRDLFHSVNKVVYLHVQPGTLQNHSLHLFDGRCQIFIWGGGGMTLKQGWLL